MYFAESSASRIDVASYDGSHRASLISANLTSPRGLAVDPSMGYLFITDWGREAKVLRADMDGRNMRVRFPFNSIILRVYPRPINPI